MREALALAKQKVLAEVMEDERVDGRDARVLSAAIAFAEKEDGWASEEAVAAARKRLKRLASIELRDAMKAAKQQVESKEGDRSSDCSIDGSASEVKGKLVRHRESGRTGVISYGPDSDGDYKITYDDDGSTSGYLKRGVLEGTTRLLVLLSAIDAAREAKIDEEGGEAGGGEGAVLLREALALAQQYMLRSAVQALQREVESKEGDRSSDCSIDGSASEVKGKLVRHRESGRTGVISYGPDSDGDYKITYDDDGSTSGYLKRGVLEGTTRLLVLLSAIDAAREAKIDEEGGEAGGGEGAVLLREALALAKQKVLAEVMEDERVDGRDARVLSAAIAFAEKEDGWASEEAVAAARKRLASIEPTKRLRDAMQAAKQQVEESNTNSSSDRQGMNAFGGGSQASSPPPSLEASTDAITAPLRSAIDAAEAGSTKAETAVIEEARQLLNELPLRIAIQQQNEGVGKLIHDNPSACSPVSELNECG